MFNCEHGDKINPKATMPDWASDAIQVEREDKTRGREDEACANRAGNHEAETQA
jgi:hypothetical protein